MSPLAKNPIANLLGKGGPSLSQYGDDSLATKEAVKSGILADFAGMGKDIPKDALVIIEALAAAIKKEPIDDRELMMEKLIGLVSHMPRSSENRTLITGGLVGQLFDSLQHPPLTYVGEKFQYRDPDGRYNNIMSPDLGMAGAPYARTIRGEKMMTGAKPDPGLLFDLLMARGNNTKENPAGLSSMLFYHASIIIHDIFRTNRQDPNISDTSSYLDLSPLYGKNREEQLAIRTMSDGRIKPDTFAEKRLLGLPPGNCVMLVMYSRFHNHVVEKLAAINEGGRFSLDRRMSPEAAAANRDEDLFQTGRLVTCGLYISISLHDYIRAIGNLPHSSSDWTLDPRMEVGPSVFDKDGTPRGIGSQVSVEFNLLYRFHSGVSKRDEKWTEEFYRQLFPVTDPKHVSLPQLLEGLAIFEKSTSDTPVHERCFGGLKRQEDGSFNDADLVKILKESIEDPAGAFGANNVPDILRHVEILGIKQARKWQVASLNEFRKFFGLKEHKTFEDINPDPYVADTLRKLYDHPDLVEMYPGMFLEECKPRMDPGMGLCGPYTVTRAVFSDAVSLVRGDRFYTLDYTAQNLTSWGISEVAPDFECMSGAKMSMLILNAFPKWFKYNSVYVVQPFFTPAENKIIFTKYKEMDKYCFDPPTLHKNPIPMLSHAAVKAVLKDSINFQVPWGTAMGYLMEGSFMLGYDGEKSVQQHRDVAKALFSLPDYQTKFKSHTENLIIKLLNRESYTLGRDPEYYQVDVVRDIGNLTAMYFASSLFCLPLKSDDNPHGCFNERELFKTMSDANIYIFFDHDPTKTWARRRRAKAGIDALAKKMLPTIEQLHNVPGLGLIHGVKNTLEAALHPAKSSLAEYGKTFVKSLFKQGNSPKEVTWILICLSLAFVANSAQAFAQIVDFYLDDKNAEHLIEIQKLAAKGDAQSEDKLMRYALEANRLTNTTGLFRNVVGKTTVTDGTRTHNVNPGDEVFCSFVAAGCDPAVFPDPMTVKLNRPLDSYIQWGDGPHQCLGRTVNMIQDMCLLKVLGKLKNFRRTPGDEGVLKFIPKTGGIKLYLTPDWSDFGAYPTTMRVQFDGPLPSPTST